MLRLSKKVDYGLMSLMHLAQHPERTSWSAREMLLSKILQKLVQKGLLISHPGIHGGYSLSRPPHRISAEEVIEAIEGPWSLTNCVSDDGLCGQFEKCNVKSPLQRLNEIVIQTFRDLSLERMSQQQGEDLKSGLVNDSPLVSISPLR
jgi:Rrf2 family protein